MSLLKLAQNQKPDFDPHDKAQQIVSDISREIGLYRAFLFGSGATSNFHVESDLDILLIFSDSTDLKTAIKKVYAKRWSEWPTDFIIKSNSDFEKRRLIGGVCYEVANYGVELKV